MPVGEPCRISPPKPGGSGALIPVCFSNPNISPELIKMEIKLYITTICSIAKKCTFCRDHFSQFLIGLRLRASPRFLRNRPFPLRSVSPTCAICSLLFLLRSLRCLSIGSVNGQEVARLSRACGTPKRLRPPPSAFALRAMADKCSRVLHSHAVATEGSSHLGFAKHPG